MKHTKKFLKRTLTVLLVLMTLFSTMSTGISAALTESMPETYTQEYDLGGSDATQTEQPETYTQEFTVGENGEMVPVDSESAAEPETEPAPELPEPVTVAPTEPEDQPAPILPSKFLARVGKDIAGVGANVDVASTGWDQSAVTIYFDASGWSVQGTLYVIIGHSSWSSCYSMTKDSGSVYKCSVPSWGGATEWYVIDASSGWGDEGQSPTHRKDWAYNASSKSTSALVNGRLYNTSLARVTYTVTWKNSDGTVLETDTVDYKGSATYNGSTPTKASTAQYSYTFSGWSGTYTNVTSNQTVTAQFSSTVRSYTVSKACSPTAGGSVTLGATSVQYNKTTTAKYTVNSGYRFSKWTISGGTLSSTSAQTTTVTVTGACTVTANFIKTYTVTFKDHNGTVLKTQTVDTGGNATAPSNPSRTGYTFAGWSGTYTNVTSDRTITATYTINSYTLTVNNGTGGGTKQYNASCTVKANSKTGHTFKNWTNGSGTVVSTSSSYTFNMPASNLTLTANYNVNSYTLTVTNGSGGGTKNYNASCTVTANSKTGYTFKNWTDGDGTVVSTSSSYTFNMPAKNYALTANYTINSYTLTVKAGSGGSVQLNGQSSTLSTKYNYNYQCTIKAIPNTGYHFTGWSYSGAKPADTSKAETTINVTQDTTVTANFAINTYAVTVQTNNSSGGTASVSTTPVNHGSTTKLTATSKNGFAFQKWEISGGYTFTDGDAYSVSPTIKVTGEVTAKAMFYSYNVRLPGSFNGWDTSSSTAMTLGSNNVYTKRVELAAGSYTFKIVKDYFGDKWYGDGGTMTDTTAGTPWDLKEGWGDITLNATGGYYTFTYSATTDKLEVAYEPYVYTVSTSVSNSSAGTAKTSASSVNISKTATLTATVNKGYTFTGWTITGSHTVTSGSTSSTSVTIAVYGNITAKANYSANSGKVSFTKTDGGSISSTGGDVTYPNEKSSTATASTGYRFTGWTISGGTDGTDYTISTGSTSSATIGIKVYTSGKTITVKANFAANTSSIEFKTSTGGSVSNTGASNVTYPSTKASTASPSYGYNFSKWTISGGTSGTDYKITSGSTTSTSITIQPLTNGKTIVATASFTKKNYTVTMQATTGGSAKADSTSVAYGGTTTITATPSTGYQFTGWTITSADTSHASTVSSTTSKSATLTVNCNVTAKANFEKITYTVTVQAGDGGTASANSTKVKYQETTTITATPSASHNFNGWTIVSGSGSFANSGSASTTLTVTGDVTIKANFKIKTFTVTFKDMGTEGTYGHNFGSETFSSVTVNYGSNATPPSVPTESGWEFYAWDTNGDGQADEGYKNVKSNVTAVAIRSNMNVQLMGLNLGWTTGTNMRMTYNANGTYTKTVRLPKGNYELKIYTEQWGNWLGNNGTVVDTTDTTAAAGWDMDGANNMVLQASGGDYAFTYDRNTNKLVIKSTPVKNKVSVSASPAAGGSATISNANVNIGDSTTLTATANKGYTFSKWTFTGTYSFVNGSATSTTVSIAPTTDVTATAVFTANKGTVKYATSTGGSVTNLGENAVTFPNEIKSTASANQGYTFSKWEISGGTSGTDYEISTGSTTSATIGIKVFTSGKTITATAKFTANTSKIKFEAGDGGSVSNAGTFDVTYPDTKASTATANTSHNFSKWVISGGTLNTDYKITSGSTTSTSITIQPLTSGKTITAKAEFAIKTFTVTFKNWDGTVLNSYTVNYGATSPTPSTPTRPSTAQYDYTFDKWDTSYSNVTSNITVTAVYKQTVRSYTVTFKDHDGTVIGTPQSIKYGSAATAPANPSRNDGYIFTGWSTDAYKNVTGNVTVTAEYRDDNVYLMGINGVWDKTSSTKMSYANVSTMTLTLNEGTYEFKFVYGDSWLSNNGEVTNTTDYNGVSNPWDTYDGNNCKLHAIGGTYEFKFNKTTKQFEIKHTPIVYTVTFVNEGTVIKTQNVNRGDNATAPANPTKAADAQYTYTFSKWDKDFTGVRSNLTVNAVYTKTVNKYTVTFKDWDDSIISTQTVAYGSAATAPANPTRTGYTFSKWDKDFSNITGALTVKAQYTINTYTVKFVNWDGSVIETQQVTYGSGATTPSTTPTRPADAQYTYTFNKWDKSYSKITSNLTVTATYLQTVNVYTVKFVDHNGKALSTQNVEYGKAATAPSNPVRSDGWIFIGWDTDAYKNVKGNTTVTAQFKDDNVYLMGVTGSWTKGDAGTIMPYNASTSSMSLELSKGNYEFKFIYNDTWLTNTGTVTDTTDQNGSSNPWETYQTEQNIKLSASGGTYTFYFNKSNNRFEVKFISNAKKVTFKNWDGTVITTAMVEEGTTAKNVAPTATRPGDAQYTYTFSGWSPSIDTVITADTVFTAQYTQTVNKYTVTFLNWNDNVLSTQTVEYGKSATAPANPTRPATAQYTYTFDGWDTDFSSVKDTLVVKAKYKATVNKYTVTFNYYSADGKTAQSTSQTVEYGKAATAPSIPTRTDGWVFTGWNPADFTHIEANLVVTADYRDDNIYLNGSFFNDWGYKEVMKQNGDIYTYTVTLVPGTYTFKLNQNYTWYGNGGTIEDTTDKTSATGWDMYTDAGNCTLQATGGAYTFKFNNATKKLIVTYAPTMYTVTFKDYDGTVLSEQQVAIGTAAKAPADPVRQSTDQYDYAFTGWDKKFDSITANMVITAKYKETLRKYTVTFKYMDADGKTEKTETQSIEYGRPAKAPEVPFRADGQAFLKWDNSFSEVKGNITVTAQYFDDNVYLMGGFNEWQMTNKLTTYGNNVVSTRVELAPGTYEFKIYHNGNYYTDVNAGTVADTTGDYWWSTTNNGNVGNTKIQATGGWYTFTFDRTNNSFKITYEPYKFDVTFVYVDTDGKTEIRKTQSVAIGKSAKAPTVPTRTDGYALRGWDKDFSNVQGTMTVTAQYFDNNIYLVGTFNGWDKTNMMTSSGNNLVSVEIELEAGEYEFKFRQDETYYTYRENDKITNSTSNEWWHTSSTMSANTKFKASGGKYTFTFATDTKDFYIHYEAYKYTVTFKDYNQQVLKVEEVAVGTSATPPANPTRTGGWEFEGWDKDFSNIQEDTTVTAKYYDNNVYLMGTFNNWGYTVLKTYGNKVLTTTIELEPGTYDFKFFQNKQYYTDKNAADIKDTTNGNWNSTTTDQSVGNTSLIAGGGIYTFSFDTETKKFSISFRPNVFDVTFVYYDTDGKTLIEDTQRVDVGKSAVAPKVPVRNDGWVFDKWDKDFSNIQDNLVVNAEYIDENIYIAGDFNMWNEKGNILKITDNGDEVEITIEFSAGEYTFKIKKGDGWYTLPNPYVTDETDGFESLTTESLENSVLKASGGYYTFTVNKVTNALDIDYEPYKYTVTFVDYDGTVLKTQVVEINGAATAPADPTRNDGFVFTGWDKMFNKIQSDITIKAQYRDDNVYLRGFEGDWTNGIKMSATSDSNVVTTTVRNIAAGTYEFKFFYNGEWYTNVGTITESITDWETYTDNSQNITLQAVKGSYIMTFNKETKRFSVEFMPDMHRVTFYYYGKVYTPDFLTSYVDVVDGGSVELPTLQTRTDSWYFLYWSERDANYQPIGTRYTETITNVTSDMEIYAFYYDDNVYLVGDVVDGEWHRTEENKMTYDFESGISQTEIHLEHGKKYDFKFIYRVNDNLEDNFYGTGATPTISVDNSNVWNNEQLYLNSGNTSFTAIGGTYTFIYNRNTNQISIKFVPDVFTVTFVDEDGKTVLKTEEVTITKNATAPVMEELRDGYRRFGGWDKSYQNVTSDLTVRAQYYDDNYYLKGSFNEWGTTNLMGEYGEATVTTGIYLEPGKYTFKINHNTGVSSTDWFGTTSAINDSTNGTTLYTDSSDCTLNASGGYYIFKFTPATNTLVVEYDPTEFTVVFKDWNGTVLDTQAVKRGNSAKAPATPTREGNVQYSYTFKEWDKAFTNVQSDLEITATYTQIVNKYNVTFNYYDAEGNATSTVVPTEYGTTAVAPEVPKRNDGWVFSYWEGDFSNIKGDTTVTAHYINGNVFLAGDFNGWNETTLPMLPTGNPDEFAITIDLHHGQSNGFKIKVGDGWFSNTGTFTDTTDVDGKSNPWDMEATHDGADTNCHINTTGGHYTFIYNVSTKKLEVKYEPFVYTVTFVDYNEVVLKTEKVEITKSATAPTTPARTGGYIFKGWDKDFSRVLNDMTVTAQYYDNNIYVKGTFNNWGTNNMLTTYGDTVVSTVIELEPGTYNFKFYQETAEGEVYYTDANAATLVDSTDWTASTDNGDIGNTTLIATGGYYTFTFANDTKSYKIDYKPYEYEVTFIYVAEDGKTEIKETQKVDRGQAAIAPEIPFRPDGFAFDGWDKTFSYVTEDLTVTAKYFDDNLYIVGDFNNWKNTNKLTAYGNAVLTTTLELQPGVYDFKFFRNGTYFTDVNAGTIDDSTNDAWWSAATSGGNTKLDATGGFYTFTFNTQTQSFKVDYVPYEYTVKFVDWNGTVLKEEVVKISFDATAPADPFREHYDFLGWDKNFTNVHSDLTVNAMYKIHSFDVTFLYYTADSKPTSVTQTVNYGNSAKAPDLPRRDDGWTFSHWDKEFSFITEDITVEAHYINDNVYLVGDFNQWNETTLPMELTEDENIVTITLTLSEGSYDFKLKRGDGWFTNTGDIPNTTDFNGASNPWYMHVSGTDGDECTLNTSGGKYTFIYNKETQMLEVKYAPYTYVVKFVNWDGTVLKEQTVNIGDDATPPMITPTRPDNGNIVYTFEGWDGNFKNVKADSIVTAKFKETTRQLTVTFVDYDGTVLKTEQVDRGASATAPETPTRPGNAQYTYTFKAWDKDFTNVTEDMTVTATYSQVVNKYTVTFLDHTGKVLDTQKVEYGSAANAPAAPVRDGYDFTGWDKDISKVTADITTTAQYVDNRVYLMGSFNGWQKTTAMKPTGENNIVTVTVQLEAGTHTFKLNQYDIWYGNNGEIVDTTTTTSDIGWEMTTTAGDCTLTATGGEYVFNFNTETKMLEVLYKLPIFTVTFLDDEGNLLKTQQVQYGMSATAPDAPVKEGYEFAGWDTDFSYITANTIVSATYTLAGVKYTVTFVDWNGAVIEVQEVNAGSAALAPADPTREGDAQYSFVFDGWDKDFSYVSEDMTVTATYKQVTNKYTVEFVDWNGTVVKKEEVEYGKSATAPSVEELNPSEGYFFKGWDKDFSYITENLVVSALYSEEGSTFTVTFVDYDGTVLDVQEVVVGEAAIAPADPSRDSTAQFEYIFTGWDKDFTAVASDLTVTAQYAERTRKYTVTFENWNGAIISSQQVEYGQAATRPDPDPVRPDNGSTTYTFIGWNKTFNYITSDLTVTALYSGSVIQFKVTFLDEVGAVLKTQWVTKGGSATAPSVPANKNGKVFTGWDKVFTNVQTDLVVTAIYRDDNVYIAGDFSSWQLESMKVTNNGNVYSYKIVLDPGVYEFKFVYQNAYYSNGGSVSDTTNGWWDASPYVANNCTLNATGGQYEFQFDKQNKKMQIIYGAPKYTVTFLDWNGEVLKTETVEQGKSATPPANPYRESTAQYTYTFNGWDNYNFTYVTSDLIVTAQYIESVNNYVVTFRDWDNSIIGQQTVEYGGSAVAPAAPTRYNYTFIGWDKSFTNVTENLVVYAQYEGDTYRITVNANEGGTAKASAYTVQYPDTVTLTATPTGDYNFKRWVFENNNFEIVSGSTTSSELIIRPRGDVTVTANFGQGVTLKVHSYSTNKYTYVYLWESNGTLSNYPAGNWPGEQSVYTTDFNGVTWQTYNEFTMTNGYSNQVGAILNNGVSNVPTGSGNLVMFNNTLGWSNVYVYTNTSWNGDAPTTSGATRYNMTRVSGTNYWYAYVSNNSSNILFIKDIQDNYGMIHQTSAVYRSDYNPEYPMFTPNTTSNETRNETVFYSNGNWGAAPTIGKQSGDFFLQSVLYTNGVWAGVDEVWLYETGTDTTIVTLRRDLLDMIARMESTYNNGENVENYTEESWTNFVNAYKNALSVSGTGSSSQTLIDNAAITLQAAYDALQKQTYLLVSVAQIGAVGTVTVNNTVINTANGAAQIDHNSDVTLNIVAPENYYITTVIANGSKRYSNTNQTISATTLTLYGITQDVDVVVTYERKLTYTITVNSYDASAGTLYYNDEPLKSTGDAIVVFAGDTVTITGQPADGYAIKSWIIDKSNEIFRTSYTFAAINENHEISVQWQKIEEINVSIVAKPNGAGVATATAQGLTASTAGAPSIKIDQFETVTLTAEVTDGRYIFEGWVIDGNYYAADETTRVDKTFNIVATGDITVTAKFVEGYRKIYLENSAGWTQPYLYFWGSNLETDEWPGTKMTYDDATGYWYVYMPYDVTNIQFNDGTNKHEVNFSDVTNNLYNNGTGTSSPYIESGYYLQGIWNMVNHTAYDLEKFEDNNDGTYSITILVTETADGYIYVNPTDELSNFWHAEENNKTDNPQYLNFVKGYTDNPNFVKVEINTEDFGMDYEVTFTFEPGTAEGDKFSWTTTPLVPTISVIASDGRGANSADINMISANNRIGDTYFTADTVVKTTSGIAFETASVISGEVVTFNTQVNDNGYGLYDYYVYGWVINGTEFVYASNMGSGLYTGSYIFTEDSTIVPVYFHTEEWLAAHDVDQVTVYAVADKNIKNWDSYLAAYTWYNDGANLDYAQFGKYPGQVMVPIAGLDGVYYTFVETTSANGVAIDGITFSNYAPAEGMDTIVVDYTNIQTYDYYEFMALLEDGKENITFVIKDTNDKYNADRLTATGDVTLSDYQFVQYTDYSGLKSDIFGNNIESINDTLADSNALYIIQAGNTASHEGVLSGDYYVKCFIYDATGKFIGSCFSYELHDKDSAIWTLLAAYENQRAYFSYEAMNGSRYDGEWYGDSDVNFKVNVSVNVGLTTDGGKNFTVNATEPVNEAIYGAGYINATYQNADIVRGDKFTLTAVPGRGYRFVGWYSQNGMLFSTNISYVATSGVGATYTAVFEELKQDNFYVNHYIYTGVGTTTSYIPKPHGGQAQLYVGITNETKGTSTPLSLTESAFIAARVGDELTITIATDALGADKFYAWYIQAYDKYGFTSFEEVGVDSVDNLYDNDGTVVGRTDMVYFQFKYVVKENVHSMTLYSDLMPVSAKVTLEYCYNDRYGNVQTYYVPYELTKEEIAGFAGNNFTPYTPAYISGAGWTNSVLANAPYIDVLHKDTTWAINSAMYDTMTFILWATQPDTLYTITSQVGDSVIVSQLPYGSVLDLDTRVIDPELSQTGFWYNDINNNGEYDESIDRILTYGPRYAYRVTRDMNVNYHETDAYDFNVTIDEPVYSREQSTNADGTNKTDKVIVDYLVNILTPYFFDGKTFVPDASKDEEMGMHVTVNALEKVGYTVDYGIILEQVGSFMPGTDAYPVYEDALIAAMEKNFGTATDSDILINEVLDGYTKPLMTSAGTYCTVYNTKSLSISNKNRYQFAFAFNNTAANQKKFFNVYSYVTVTTPEGVTSTYISNVQTLNIYLTGTSSASVNDNTTFG